MGNEKPPPVLAVIGLVAVVLPLLNRASYEVASSQGLLSELNETPRNREAGDAGASDTFSTDQFYWPSGYVFEAGRQYRITLITDGDWFDKDLRADVTGVARRPVAHILAAPIKRWWFEPYFQPIARIGNTGNDEYVLRPDPPPPAAHDYEKSRRGEPPEIHTGHFEKISVDEYCALMKTYPVPDDRKTLHSTLTARSSGELFLYVNDAMLMLPGSVRKFYSNNYGTAQVEVEQILPGGKAEQLARKAGRR